jgi:cell division protein FtsN
MTNYHAEFSTTETRIQLQPATTPLPPSPQSLAPEPTYETTSPSVLPWEEPPYETASVEDREDYYYPEDNYYEDGYYNYDLPVDVGGWALAPAEPRPPQQEAYPVVVPSAGGNFFVVQVGAFQDKKLADAAYAALKQEGFNPNYEDYQDLTRVFIPEVEPKDLARTRDRVKALGFGEPYIRQ